MSIKKNLLDLKAKLPAHVTLVAVTKTKSEEEIMEAYNAGHHVFGENKIQEMVRKWEALPKDIEWHMIGHVQRNKVKYMASFVNMIHGVDSMKLLREIDKQAKKHNRVINCLLQIHIAEEATKFGLSEDEVMELIHTEEFAQLQNVAIVGIMGMATFTDDHQLIQREFHSLKEFFQKLRTRLPQIDTLSMGMSGDFPIAIEEGTTMVRIGSSIFGPRNYN
ncbi:MAG: YggS family pyridoxal phosphate-dependent enzyme [Flavobacteriaceae bacterium]